MAGTVAYVGQSRFIVQRIIRLRDHVLALDVILNGNSRFDRETWKNVANKINRLEAEIKTSTVKMSVPNNLDVARDIFRNNLEFSELVNKSGFFPTKPIEAFLDLARYGLVRFASVFLILVWLNSQPREDRGSSHVQLDKKLFNYFGIKPHKNNRNLLVQEQIIVRVNMNSRNEIRNKWTFTDICIDTLAAFLKEKLGVNRLSAQIFMNDFESIFTKEKFVDQTMNNENFCHLFEVCLFNFMNANAICLKNKIPIGIIVNSGKNFTFHTNQFLEFYRESMLSLLKKMSPHDQRELRSLVGHNLSFKLLNRFPI